MMRLEKVALKLDRSFALSLSLSLCGGEAENETNQNEVWDPHSLSINSGVLFSYGLSNIDGGAHIFYNPKLGSSESTLKTFGFQTRSNLWLLRAGPLVSIWALFFWPMGCVPRTNFLAWILYGLGLRPYILSKWVGHWTYFQPAV